MNEMTNQPVHLGQNSSMPGSYKIASQIPFGEYIVELHHLALVATDHNSPAVMMSFAPVGSGNLIGMLQVIQNGFQVHAVNELLRTITKQSVCVEYRTYAQYAAMLCDLGRELFGQIFRLNYFPNRRGESVEIAPLFEIT